MNNNDIPFIFMFCRSDSFKFILIQNHLSSSRLEFWCKTFYFVVLCENKTWWECTIPDKTCYNLLLCIHIQNYWWTELLYVMLWHSDGYSWLFVFLYFLLFFFFTILVAMTRVTCERFPLEVVKKAHLLCSLSQSRADILSLH